MPAQRTPYGAPRARGALRDAPVPKTPVTPPHAPAPHHAADPEAATGALPAPTVAPGRAAAATPLKCQQAALLSLVTLVRERGVSSPAPFERALAALLGTLRKSPLPVLPTALLTVSTFVAVLGVRLVPLLPTLMPVLLDCLEDRLGNAQQVELLALLPPRARDGVRRSPRVEGQLLRLVLHQLHQPRARACHADGAALTRAASHACVVGAGSGGAARRYAMLCYAIYAARPA